jgi:hypothetical protein
MTRAAARRDRATLVVGFLGAATTTATVTATLSLAAALTPPEPPRVQAPVGPASRPGTDVDLSPPATAPSTAGHGAAGTGQGSIPRTSGS